MKTTLGVTGTVALSVFLAVFLSACGGGGGDVSGVDGGTSADTSAPTSPSNLAASAVSSSQIDLSWTASTDNVGVTGYTIYRDNVEIGTTTATSYSDTGPAVNTTHCYTVRARDAAGNVSGHSNQSCATTIDSASPSIVSDLAAIAVSNSQIDLSWTAATDNVGVEGYRIYRDGAEIGTTTGTSYSDSDLAFNTHYCYSAKAYDADGNLSAEGNNTCATTNVGYDGIKWQYQTDDAIYYSSPAIGSDGTLYVGNGSSGSAKALHAVNADGTMKWKYEIANPVFTPAVGADGTVYVQDFYGTLYAIDASGTEKWRYTLGASYNVGLSSPAIGSDGTIYIVADAIYAMNPDGSVKWQYSPMIEGHMPPRIIHSSPGIASDGTVYFGTEAGGIATLFAVRSNGTLGWQRNLQGAEWIFSSPAIGSDGTVYVGGEGGSLGYVFAVSSNGSVRWKYEVSGGRPVRSSPAVGADGTIYVATKTSGTTNAELLALDSGGTLKWSFAVEDADIYCSPAIGQDGLIYFGAENGIFYALNSDGTENWKYSTNNGITWSSPAIGGDGTIYIGNVEGYLFALKSSSLGLADSTWPKFRRDNKNTGRFSP